MVTPDIKNNAATGGRGFCLPELSIYPINYASGMHVFFSKESAGQCVTFHIDHIDLVIDRLVQIRDGVKL